MYTPTAVFFLCVFNSVWCETLQEHTGDNVELLQSSAPEQRKPNEEVHKPTQLKRRAYHLGSSKHKFEAVSKPGSNKLTFVYYPKHANLKRGGPRRRAVSGETTDSVDIIMEMLTYVQGYLEEYGIHHTLKGGTLLGAVRQCSVMQWDHDADINIFQNASQLKYLYQNATKHKFSKRVKVEERFGVAEGEEPVKLDLIFRGDAYCTDTKPGTTAHDYCAPTVPCALDQLVFKCTTAAQHYFTHHYGDDWLTPNPDGRSTWSNGLDAEDFSKEFKKRRDECRARDSSLLLANDDGTIQNGE